MPSALMLVRHRPGCCVVVTHLPSLMLIVSLGQVQRCVGLCLTLSGGLLWLCICQSHILAALYLNALLVTFN